MNSPMTHKELAQTAAGILIVFGSAALVIFLAFPSMKKAMEVNADQKWCIDVYSGGVGIGAFKGYRPSVVSSDGSMLFQDDVKGEIRIRGDWILEKCE